MKNFRSSKHLKQVDLQAKEEVGLRQKIKQLEEQVELLQKTHLNLSIPVSEKQTGAHNNFEAIIARLRTQLLASQQQNMKSKGIIKKLQKEKEVMKIHHQNQIAELQKRNKQLQQQYDSSLEQIQDLESELQQLQQKYSGIEKQVIEKRVEVKFLTEDLSTQKEKTQHYQKRAHQLEHQILAVNYGSRIYHSHDKKITAIQTVQLLKLKAYIEQLEDKIRKMQQRTKSIDNGREKQNLGEQIVRLKTNLDLQLGISSKSSHAQNFLQHYNDTNNLFETLIDNCKLGKSK